MLIKIFEKLIINNTNSVYLNKILNKLSGKLFIFSILFYR